MYPRPLFLFRTNVNKSSLFCFWMQCTDFSLNRSTWLALFSTRAPPCLIILVMWCGSCYSGLLSPRFNGVGWLDLPHHPPLPKGIKFRYPMFWWTFRPCLLRKVEMKWNQDLNLVGLRMKLESWTQLFGENWNELRF